MRRTRTAATALAAALLALSPITAFAAPDPAALPDPAPVTGDTVVHDPSMVRTPHGYLVYSTHGGLEARSSKDLKTFSRTGSAFPTAPSWWFDYSSSGDPWAPDISFHHGKYWLYYAVSSFGTNHSAIGLATSKTGAAGSWTDLGIVYATNTTDDHNAIDPALVVDRKGRWWLSFGSFWTGIRMIQLNPHTGKRLDSDPTLYHLATRPDDPFAVEAPYIIEHGGFYYLFASYDFCCRGVNSTYKIKVGRSTSPTGPYVDRDGMPMLNGGGNEVLSTHGRFIGPGGQVVMRDKGKDVLVYHYYDGTDNGTPKLGMNQLRWDAEGWPSAR